MVCVVLAGAVAFCAAGVSRAGSVAAQDHHAAWTALADAYFDEVYFKFSPTQGTGVGFHQYDRLLEDYSRAGVDRQVAALHAFERRVESFDPKGLTESEAADRQMVLSNIRGTLLELETIRPWEKDPDTYSSGVTFAAYAIMSREFAPAGRAAAFGDCPRAADARGVCRGAREPEEFSAHLHRDRHRAASRQHRISSGRACRRRSLA